MNYIWIFGLSPNTRKHLEGPRSHICRRTLCHLGEDQGINRNEMELVFSLANSTWTLCAPERTLQRPQIHICAAASSILARTMRENHCGNKVGALLLQSLTFSKAKRKQCYYHGLGQDGHAHQTINTQHYTSKTLPNQICSRLFVKRERGKRER